jgi:hypothetical protein
MLKRVVAPRLMGGIVSGGTLLREDSVEDKH